MVAIVLVVDKSGSMQKWQSDIIDGHKLMIQGLLGAHPKFDLRFGQILFNHKVEYCQPICEFRDQSDPKRASSHVKLLDTQNYKPNGFTALYDAILKGIAIMKSNLVDDKKWKRFTKWLQDKEPGRWYMPTSEEKVLAAFILNGTRYYLGSEPSSLTKEDISNGIKETCG
jgi:hypothetical protein